jgi:translation elongation factor EF-1alpha
MIKERPKKLIKGNYAQITLKLEYRICLELAANNKAMGRIALRDGEETIAAGVVIEMIN